MEKIKCYLLQLLRTGCLGAIFIPGNVDLTVSQISINGVVACEKKDFLNFKSYIIELYDDNSIKTLADIDNFGTFSKKYEAKFGKHLAVLALKRNSKPIERIEFISDEKHKEFSLKFKTCE